MWLFRKKTREELQLRAYQDGGYSVKECDTLMRITRQYFNDDGPRLWRCERRSHNKKRCPYCGGVVIELSSEKKTRPPGSARAIVGANCVHYGFFCVSCGGEMICDEPGCKYRVGDLLCNRTSHFNATDFGHKKFKVKTRKGARNLFDILDGLEKEKPGVPEQAKELEPEDEYESHERRLEGIAEERLQLEEEEINIRARMHEIDVAIAYSMLPEIEPEPALLRAADDDLQVVREAEAVVDELAPAAEEGDG